MSNELITKLSFLRLQKANLKRTLDLNYYNAELRTKLFKRIKDVENEIEKTKFRIRLERENKNENNNTNESNN